MGDGSIFQDVDLQVCDGCKYCYVILEFLVSYWGCWINNGFGYFFKEKYLFYWEDCYICVLMGFGCIDDCKRYYKVKVLFFKEKDYLGWLNVYEFWCDEHINNVEFGFKLFGLMVMVDYRLFICVVRMIMEWIFVCGLMGVEGVWFDDLVFDFVVLGYRYWEFMKVIVMSLVYWRV